MTLLAGFLGSGKTTLVRRILAAAQNDPEQRIAVVVNEFGALGIDGDLVVREESDGQSSIVELAGGCICCEIQEDLRTALLDVVRAVRRTSGEPPRFLRWLRRAPRPVTRVLIEASGAASPGAAVQTLLVDGEIAEHLHLAGVVTLCHAALIEDELASREESAQQIAYADRIVVNHTDRVTEPEAARIAGVLAEKNPLAEVRTAVRADVPLEWVLGEAPAGVPRADPPAHGPHRHTEGLASISLESDAAVDPDALRMWLEFLAARRGAELMRTKGILRARNGGVLEVQGIHAWLEIGRVGGEEPGTSRLVLIGTGLDEAEVQRGWEAVLAH